MKKILSLWLLLWGLSFSVTAQKYKIGIVLSGGGALGFAHIGVLQALEDHGIRPQIISGTSMGALIGAMYANGMSPQDIFEMVKVERLDKISSFLDVSLRNPRTRLGVSSQDDLYDILIKYLPHNSFDMLQKPYYLCTSNLTIGQVEIIHEGDRLVKYLQGSSCIPGFFAPTVIDSMYYVDGGVYNNLPAQPIRKQCKVLIASDVNPTSGFKPVKTMGDVMSRSLSLMIHENTKEGRNMCDFVIDVPANMFYSVMDFSKFYSIYQIGYKSGLEFIKQHPEILNAR